MAIVLPENRTVYPLVISQISFPKDVDVSVQDYEAEEVDGAVRPFLVCSDVPVILKIETWTGVIKVHKFVPGIYWMPLRKIFTDAGNSETIIQIGY